jgi:hypothetical protein
MLGSFDICISSWIAVKCLFSIAQRSRMRYVMQTTTNKKKNKRYHTFVLHFIVLFVFHLLFCASIQVSLLCVIFV